jgi:hypothetical protein
VPDDGYFDEPVAARYDESSAEMFEPTSAKAMSASTSTTSRNRD